MNLLVLLALILIGAGYYMNQNASQSESSTGGYSINALALAIRTFEGYYPGTRSYRNNNPGNIKFANQPGTTGQDDKGFAVFVTYQDGWNALIALIRKRISQHPAWTILDFFMSYAPPSDNNPTQEYAQTVANAVGASSDTQIGLFS